VRACVRACMRASCVTCMRCESWNSRSFYVYIYLTFGLYVYGRAHLSIYPYNSIHTYAYIYIHICIYTYIYMYIYIHVYICLLTYMIDWCCFVYICLLTWCNLWICSMSHVFNCVHTTITDHTLTFTSVPPPNVGFLSLLVSSDDWGASCWFVFL